jgi:nucleotide-binding universal stress UspA family protein
MTETMVIATDGSKQATNAIRAGAQLAEKLGAEVVLVHVLPDHLTAAAARDLVAFDRLPAGAREEIARLEDVERKANAFVESAVSAVRLSPATADAIGNLILDNAEALVRNHLAGKIQRATMSGDPASGILEMARTSRAGFIVMGKRGLGRLTGLLVGSVSQKVSALADCTCIIVP